MGDVESGAEATDGAERGGAEGGSSKADEYLQNLVRLKADFDNYRRRTAQDQARWGEAAVAEFIAQVLPVVDNLQRAMTAVGDVAAVRRGVEMTLRQLDGVLAAAGVTAMSVLGQPFDPARHEAVARGPVVGVAAGSVAEEYRKGYLLRDQVLRPAMVKVAVEVAAESAPAADGPSAEPGQAADPAGARGPAPGDAGTAEAGADTVAGTAADRAAGTARDRAAGTATDRAAGTKEGDR